MALESTLEKLRAKPDHVRTRIAFWASLGVTAVIFAFWSASFTAAGPSARGAVVDAASKVESPGSSLVAGVGNFFVDIKEMIFGAKKITYSEVIVTPGEK